MSALALSQYPFIWLTSLAVFLFLVVFLGVVFWTFRPGALEIYEQAERLPIEEGAFEGGDHGRR